MYVCSYLQCPLSSGLNQQPRSPIYGQGTVRERSGPSQGHQEIEGQKHSRQLTAKRGKSATTKASARSEPRSGPSPGGADRLIKGAGWSNARPLGRHQPTCTFLPMTVATAAMASSRDPYHYRPGIPAPAGLPSSMAAIRGTVARPAPRQKQETWWDGAAPGYQLPATHQQRPCCKGPRGGNMQPNTGARRPSAPRRVHKLCRMPLLLPSLLSAMPVPGGSRRPGRRDLARAGARAHCRTQPGPAAPLHHGVTGNPLKQAPSSLLVLGRHGGRTRCSPLISAATSPALNVPGSIQRHVKACRPCPSAAAARGSQAAAPSSWQPHPRSPTGPPLPGQPGRIPSAAPLPAAPTSRP